MPLTVPVLRVLEACRGQRISGPLIHRPVSGKPVDRRDVYRMVIRIAKAAKIPRHRDALVAPCATTMRHLPSEVLLEPGEVPVPLRSAANLMPPTVRQSQHNRQPRANRGGRASRATTHGRRSRLARPRLVRR